MRLFQHLTRTSSIRPLFSRLYSSEANAELDLIVIGAGPGGYVAAIRAAQLGLRTACIEKRGALGGTCLNVGCIPSKALLHNSHLYHVAKTDLASRGIDVSGVALNLPAMLAYKDKAVVGLTKGIEYLFKKNKVEYVLGAGRITSPNAVEVTDAKSGAKRSLTAKNILVATGSEPISLPGLAFDETRIVSSTGALSLHRVPERLAVIGGGVIGLELGSVWARLGSKVTVIEAMDAIGGGMDAGIASAFHKLLAKQGMQFRLGTKFVGAKVAAAGSSAPHELEVEPAKGGARETLAADVVLVAVGRRPYTAGLGLDAVGVRLDARGRIATDAEFRTNVPSIRAIGDVITGPMLAHKAEDEGLAVVSLIAGRPGAVHYNAIPSVVYTHPEVAWVGLTEEQLKTAGTAYVAGSFPFLANSRAKTNADADGLVKVLADSKTGAILGAHIIGPNAGEMIAEAVLAIQHGLTADAVAETCHAHPTLSEAFKEACMAAGSLKKPIHF